MRGRWLFSNPVTYIASYICSFEVTLNGYIDPLLWSLGSGTKSVSIKAKSGS